MAKLVSYPKPQFYGVEAFGLTDYLSDKFRKVQKETLDRRTKLYKKRVLSRLGSDIPLAVLEFGLSVFLAIWVIVGRITIGSLQLYLRALRSTQSNLGGLVGAFLEIYENYIYVADLVWFLNLEPKIEASSQGGQMLKAEGGITFDNVWFRYKNDQPWVIRGVSFEIKPKEKIALVGLNGVGKSTLIKLLSCFYDPQKGTVEYGGENIADFHLRSWRDNLSILFQEFETYPFSAYEAVGYGDVIRLKKKKEIRLAIAKTGMSEFVESLPLKYKNALDPDFEKGVRPSAGQWQRLGIARMLFRKNAGILIMDEPTSNVDPEAEEKIFNELVRHARNKILIFVTQRFSTVRHADRIFVLDKGKIVEAGTHSELMKLDGKYAKLFKLQAKGYQENLSPTF